LKSKIGQLVTLLVLSAIMLLGILMVASSYPGVGVTSEVGTGGLPLAAYDGSAIPQSVIEDATEMAKTLFGDSQEKANNFVSQVLAIYSKAEDKDFIILFNSPGHESVSQPVYPFFKRFPSNLFPDIFAWCYLD